MMCRPSAIMGPKKFSCCSPLVSHAGYRRLLGKMEHRLPDFQGLGHNLLLAALLDHLPFSKPSAVPPIAWPMLWSLGFVHRPIIAKK
jgi:hypothetical protein